MVSSSIQAFLLAASGLFSIVNPIGSALIFSQYTVERTHQERIVLARRIGIYSGVLMLGALWCGTAVLGFFGISLSALRIAGGLFVVSSAWSMLHAPERQEQRKQEQAAEAEGLEDVAFFPLTTPFTVGPGTISVAIALGSNLRSEQPDFAMTAIVTSLAAIVVAASVWLAYASADRVVALLGRARAQVLSRVSAFLLLCIGTQIALGGIADFARSLD